MKIFFKKFLFIPFFFFLFLSPLTRLQGTFYELNSPSQGHGLFSVCSMVIGLLHYYDAGYLEGMRVDFKDQGIYYDPLYGNNWWEYYFEPINLGNENGNKVIASPSDHGNLTLLCTYGLSRSRVHELLEKYVHVKTHIKDKINHFVKEKFEPYFVIGVHFRGTDKIREAPRVEFETIKEKIKQVMREQGRKRYKIFVASDEQQFLDYMKKNFHNVIYVDNFFRSTDNQPVHFTYNQNYKKGEEAVIDCLLLSKCHYLIRTNSHLSQFSAYFNADMPVIELNTPFWHNQ